MGTADQMYIPASYQLVFFHINVAFYSLLDDSKVFLLVHIYIHALRQLKVGEQEGPLVFQLQSQSDCDFPVLGCPRPVIGRLIGKSRRISSSGEKVAPAKGWDSRDGDCTATGMSNSVAS